MKLASKTISIRALMPFVILGLAVLLAPVGVFAQNQSPVADDDSAVTGKNTLVEIDVVSNDTDPNGDDTLNLATGVRIMVQPLNGTANYIDDGFFDYTPSLDFIGSDSFVYEICDNATPALCDTATVYIEVANLIPFNVIPKKLNIKKNGVLPVVVYGSEDVDVAMIDPSTLQIEGVDPLRWNVSSHKITLKFSAQDIVDAIGEVSDGEEVVLHLTGNLIEDAGEEAIVGENTVLIINKGKAKPPKPPKPPKM